MAAPDPSNPGTVDGVAAPARRGAAPFSRRLLVLAGLLSMALALAWLRQDLGRIGHRELAQALQAIPAVRLAAALALTLAGYALLVGYDLIGLRHLGERVPWRVAAGAALLSGATGNNVGNALLAGSAVRLALYTAAGLGVRRIAALVLLCSLAFWLGFAVLGMVFLLGMPVAAPSGATAAGMQAVGALCTVALLGWGAIVARGDEVVLGRWRWRPPSRALSLCQAGIACGDLLLMAGALYVLLPAGSGLSFPAFMPVFLIALLAGNASQSPGGLGVFEAVVLGLAPPASDTRTWFAALLAFRAIYLLLPLLVAWAATGVLGALRLARAAAARPRASAGWLVAAAPQAFAALAFASGVVLLMSGAMPAAVGRLAFVDRQVALPVIEVSHFMASLVGAALLVVAHGLHRRLDAAWLIACVLAAVAVLLSLVKGWDYEEAGLMLAVCLALLPARRLFHRTSSLLDTAYTPAWAGAFVAVLATTAGLTAFAHARSAWASQTWWNFALHAEAARSLRASVGASSLLMLLALHRLIRPPRAPAGAATAEEIERARPLVERSPWTSANLVYRADKSVLFSAAGDAFLMYGRHGRSWIALGDPIGAEAGSRELVRRFSELSDRNDGRCVFFEVRPRWRDLYGQVGLALTPLGEEARVDLARFTLDTPSHRDLRQARAHLLRSGWRFEILPPEAVPAVLPALADVSRAWLARKATHEKGFSNASFDTAYLRRFPVAVVRRKDAIAAFANLWVGADRAELSVDLMRHRPDAPSGTMDFLFAELLAWGRQQGFAWFNFGMAPLAGLDARRDAPLWGRLGGFIYRHAEHFYNFEGLRRYKAKFDPVWTPLYLASPGGIALAPVLVDVTALIAGGLSGIVSRYAVPARQAAA